MVEILVILILGLLPGCLSWWKIRRAEQQFQARVQQTLWQTQAGLMPVEFGQVGHSRTAAEEEVGDRKAFAIGDLSCRYNARSTYLRCAVNPLGPCSVCRSYEPVEPLPSAGN